MTGKVKSELWDENEFDDMFSKIFEGGDESEARQRAAEDWVVGRRSESPYPRGSLEDLAYTAEQQQRWRDNAQF